MNDSHLLAALDQLRNIMTTVATGGSRIDDVNNEYQHLYREVDDELGNGCDAPTVKEPGDICVRG